jgi:hypothetical protein
MYGWQNEDGEPIMDGAAYRFEQELDAQSAEERFWDGMDSWDDYGDDWEDDAPEHDDEDSEPWEDEDGWLDGSYEQD